MTGYNMPFGCTNADLPLAPHPYEAEYDFDAAFEKFRQWSKTDRESAAEKGREIVRQLCKIGDYDGAWEVVAEIEQLMRAI